MQQTAYTFTHQNVSAAGLPHSLSCYHPWGQLTVLLVVLVLLATGKVLPLSTCSCDDDSGEEAEGALEMRCRRSPVDFSVAAAEEPDTDTAIRSYEQARE